MSPSSIIENDSTFRLWIVCGVFYFRIYRPWKKSGESIIDTHIKPSSQDIEGSYSGGDFPPANDKLQVTYLEKSSLNTARAEYIPLLLVLSIVIPFSVHAGVFGSVVGLFDTSNTIQNDSSTALSAFEVVTNEPVYLSATKSPDPKGASGGGDVFVREGYLVHSGPSGDDDGSVSKTSNGEISVYVVREGDSLSQIAEMYDVTTNTILWANDLSSATDIHPGDSLVILPIVGIRHVVKESDTIASIAKKYKGNIEEILSYNQVASADALSVGDTLVIPGGELAQTAPVKITAKNSSGGGTTGAFSHPLPGAVRSQGIHGYNGVDLAAPAGTPIRAAAAGEVIIAKPSGWNGGYGNYVVIKHANGTQTLYAHNSRNAVVAGEYVAVGQTIGYVGSTGRSTGAHLHFEVRGSRNPF